jgi:hypothetical protein
MDIPESEYHPCPIVLSRPRVEFVSLLVLVLLLLLLDDVWAEMAGVGNVEEAMANALFPRV